MTALHLARGGTAGLIQPQLRCKTPLLALCCSQLKCGLSVCGVVCGLAGHCVHKALGHIRQVRSLVMPLLL